MSSPLSEVALATLVTQARTANAWLDRSVDDALLRRLYDLVKLGPTSANCCPARFVFVRSNEAKSRMLSHVSKGNLEKTRTAPVTVIVAYDSAFYDHLPTLFPHADAKSWFTSSPEAAKETATRNSALQAGYLILIARALGMDAGPMSGFDRSSLDREFFESTNWRSDILINLGYADPAATFERLPRLGFETACQIL
jgi:3-hydroxypropanoate dehydrogenase